MSEASITLSEALDMFDSLLCTNLPVITETESMPVVAQCVIGAVGRFLRMERAIASISVGEIDIRVVDTGTPFGNSGHFCRNLFSL